jgi:hypothetical protein
MEYIGERVPRGNLAGAHREVLRDVAASLLAGTQSHVLRKPEGMCGRWVSAELD